MRDELIRDLDVIENIMISLAEERQKKGALHTTIVIYGLLWWMAKAIYDLLRWAIRKEKA